MRQSVGGEGRLLPTGSAGQHDVPCRHIARTDFQAQRDSPPLPLVVLGAGLHPVSRVEMHPDPAGLELAIHVLGGVEHGRSSSVL